MSKWAPTARTTHKGCAARSTGCALQDSTITNITYCARKSYYLSPLREEERSGRILIWRQLNGDVVRRYAAMAEARRNPGFREWQRALADLNAICRSIRSEVPPAEPQHEERAEAGE